MFSTFAVAECPRHKVKDLVTNRLTRKWGTFLDTIPLTLDKFNRPENMFTLPSESFRVKIYDEILCWFNHPKEYKKATFVHLTKFIERAEEFQSLCLSWMTLRRAAVWKMSNDIGAMNSIQEYENMHAILSLCREQLTYIFSHEKKLYMPNYADKKTIDVYDSRSIVYNSWERFDPILVMLIRMYQLAYALRMVAVESFKDDDPQSHESYQQDASQSGYWYPMTDKRDINKFELSVEEISDAISNEIDTIVKHAEKEYTRTQPHVGNIVTVLTWIYNPREMGNGHYERMYGTVVAESAKQVRIKWVNRNPSSEWKNVVPRITQHKEDLSKGFQTNWGINWGHKNGKWYNKLPNITSHTVEVEKKKWSVRLGARNLLDFTDNSNYKKLNVDFAPINRNYTWWVGRVPYVEIAPENLCSIDVSTLGLDQCRQLLLRIKTDDIYVLHSEHAYRVWLRDYCKEKRAEVQYERKRSAMSRRSNTNRRLSLNY